MHRPIKTRRLKKADFEADFFFMELVESGLHSTLRLPEHRSAISFILLVSPPTTCQHYSFESMENLSEHRDRANKMESPSHDSLARCRINERRGTSVRRCKSRLNRAWLVGSLTA